MPNFINVSLIVCPQWSGNESVTPGRPPAHPPAGRTKFFPTNYNTREQFLPRVKNSPVSSMTLSYSSCWNHIQFAHKSFLSSLCYCCSTRNHYFCSFVICDLVENDLVRFVTPLHSLSLSDITFPP